MFLLTNKKLLLLIVVVFTHYISRSQCQVDFLYSQNDLVVQFTDMSTSASGSVVLHFWSFGDGTVSHIQNPVHQYNAPGVYTVMHSIQNSTGNCNDTIMKMISVSAPSYRQVEVCPPATVTLSSWLNATNYQWQVSVDSINYTNILTSAYYSGINSPTLQLHNLPSSFTGYHYRCIGDSSISTIHYLSFSNYFTGSSSSLWSDASNWSCGSLPDMYTDVIIPAGQVVVNTNIIVRSLDIRPGARIHVQPGVIVTILK